MFRTHVLTLFPDMFPGPLGYSLTGRALQEKRWSLVATDIRDFGIGKHRQVDDTPYGGGAGMVMRADVLGPAIEAAQAQYPEARLLCMSPRGTPLTQQLAMRLSSETSGLIIICGRFEGIDERIFTAYQPLEVSIGDVVLTGGELAAMALLDSCVRLLPGVIGQQESLQTESFGLNPDYADLLEHPHYTKPGIWRDFSVPEVLTNGHHQHIETWRKSQAEAITQARRPDLWRAYQQRNPKGSDS